jgi:two-component sensor histidine kinase
MQHVAAQVSRVTEVTHIKILRHRPERGDLLIEAGVGWNPEVVGHVALSADYHSPAGRALQTGAPVAIRNIYESNEFRLPDVLRDHGIVSLLNVPVMINGATWGVLEVDSNKPMTFDEWDTSFLVLVANIMGICIALYEAKQKHVNDLAEAAREHERAEMATRELQHRIKNNLQVIIAFLAHKLSDVSPEIRERLNSVIGRIQAVGLAHDLLSATNEAASVRLDAYLRSLCSNLDLQRSDVIIEIEAEQIVIPIDRAVPAGLVVNELVTNALKYAFDNTGGHIRIHLQIVSNRSEAIISVEDDGRGMEVPPRKGVGLRLIEGFAQQIQGRIEYPQVEKGSKIVLCFPFAATG